MRMDPARSVADCLKMCKGTVSALATMAGEPGYRWTNSRCRPETPARSAGLRLAREPGWRRPGSRVRPYLVTRLERALGAGGRHAGIREAAWPCHTPAVRPCRAPG